MNGPFVVDASIAIAWIHPAQASRDSEAMLDAVAAGCALEAPPIWPLEVANAVVTLRRRGKLTDDEARIGLERMASLPVRVDHEPSIAFTILADLAASLDLSVYDAAYVELATRRRLPLASKDARLRRAAAKSGVTLWSR
jgi:predicted nucleic acid-binding protein